MAATLITAKTTLLMVGLVAQVAEAAQVDKAEPAPQAKETMAAEIRVAQSEAVAAEVLAHKAQTVAVLVVRLVMVWTTLHGQQQPQQETQGSMLVEAQVAPVHHPEEMVAVRMHYLTALLQRVKQILAAEVLGTTAGLMQDQTVDQASLSSVILHRKLEHGTLRKSKRRYR